MKTNLLPFALSVLLALPVTAQTGAETPEALVMRQIDAWNRHDGLCRCIRR
jgi:hypothetical protein